MKNIAITTRLVSDLKHDEIRDSLDIKWIELLRNINFNPIIIPTGVDYGEYLDSQNIDGIIFTGGNDLFSIKRCHLSELRDNKERKILQYAIDESVPTYGICRGMQFLAEYFGSTLKILPNHVAVHHKIITTQTFWGSEYLSNVYNVNSYHRYGIEDLGINLKAVAISNEDSSIEAFIHKKHKIFAQMWHPERENPFKDLDIHLLKSFFTN